MKFKLDIGDWSSDGHGKTQTVLFDASCKTEAELKRAWSSAGKSTPRDIHPENVCDKYECSHVSSALRDKIEGHYNIQFGDSYEDKVWVTAEDMGELVAAFLTLGGVKTKVIDDTIPHIQLGSIGYGVLS